MTCRAQHKISAAAQAFFLPLSMVTTMMVAPVGLVRAGGGDHQVSVRRRGEKAP
ncbi:MAG: hypothetical protein ACRDND_10015 [Streptosporangiaceae bacterium]